MKHRMREANHRPRIETQESEVKSMEPNIETRADGDSKKFWPAGEALPDAFKRQALQPCPECRRVLMDDGGRAVAVTGSGADVAYFRCKACGARWKLPVE